MIKEIIVGDITSKDNRADIIIGMNSQLHDVTGIGTPFVNKVKTAHPIDLGGVLSFKFDEGRHVHMIICHHLGKDGWIGAEMHVRFGLDYLWKTEGNRRKFSIVQVGTGRVGTRDGADPVSIRTAMATSFLQVKLFIHNPLETKAAHVSLKRPMVAYRAWHPTMGEERLVA